MTAQLVPDDLVWNQEGAIVVEAGEKLGRAFPIIIDSKNVSWMKKAGFQNVDENCLKLPQGIWAAKLELETINHYNICVTERGLECFSLYVLTEVHD
ncbi:hypothetical protein QQZ08_007524 [Neonectria magnoliae]|uniref:Uncharacterized protein n=1 Tax=Neonectria magnoliae TaxID=2732573 RepID=A0ABR1HYT6_9HYPO